MANLSMDIWNEIQGVLNQQNTDCLEVQIEKRDGTIRHAVEQFLKKIPSFKLDTVTSIGCDFHDKIEEAIKEAIKLYANELRKEGKAAVRKITAKKPYAIAQAEIKLDAHLSDYLTSSDPSTQLILGMTNIFFTQKADLRYDAVEKGGEWIFVNGRYERTRGIIGTVQFVSIPQ